MADLYLYPIADFNISGNYVNENGGNIYEEVDENQTSDDFANMVANCDAATSRVYGAANGDDISVVFDMTSEDITGLEGNLTSGKMRVVARQLRDDTPDAGGNATDIGLTFTASQNDGATWSFGSASTVDIATADYTLFEADLSAFDITQFNALSGITNIGIRVQCTGGGGGPSVRTTFDITAAMLYLDYTVASGRKRYRMIM